MSAQPNRRCNCCQAVKLARTPKNRVDQMSATTRDHCTRIGSGRPRRFRTSSSIEVQAHHRPADRRRDHEQDERLIDADEQDERPEPNQQPHEPEIQAALGNCRGLQIRRLEDACGEPARVVGDSHRRGKERERADAPEQQAEPRANNLRRSAGLRSAGRQRSAAALACRRASSVPASTSGRLSRL